MNPRSIAILSSGLVTSVGLTAASSCAAIRAKLTNPIETRFIDSDGEWIMAHGVPLERPSAGRIKLVRMAALAINDCLRDIPRDEWSQMPLLVCVAERNRPGRLEGLDELVFAELETELGLEFSSPKHLVPNGRASIGTALVRARHLLADDAFPYVLIVGTDSLLHWPTMSVYERQQRLLTANNSNGFMPGEGAAALLVGPATAEDELLCTGIGIATETAHISDEQPLRGEGLAQAIKAAVSDAGCLMQDLDFRITDLSGEQYYFKEAALAIARVFRSRKSTFDIWHPAECIGESGAMSGIAAIVIASMAYKKGYAPGPAVLCHSSMDGGERVATIFQFRSRA